MSDVVRKPLSLGTDPLSRTKDKDVPNLIGTGDSNQRLQKPKQQLPQLSRSPSDTDTSTKAASNIGLHGGKIRAFAEREPPQIAVVADLADYEGGTIEIEIATEEGGATTTSRFVVPHGEKCRAVSTAGDVYTGGFVRGLREGHGRLQCADGVEYDGQWLAGERSGVGTLRTLGGRIYQGEWLHDLRHGEGLFVWSNGDVYKGGWSHNRRSGVGTYNYADGQWYQGEYVDGQRHGSGCVTRPNGSSYRGGFIKGKKHGLGVATPPLSLQSTKEMTLERWSFGKLVESQPYDPAVLLLDQEDSSDCQSLGPQLAEGRDAAIQLAGLKSTVEKYQEWARLPLHLAAYKADLVALERFVRFADLTKADLNGRTALHIATRHGNVAVAEALINHGADPARGTPRGENSLHFLVRNKSRRRVSRLVQLARRLIGCSSTSTSVNDGDLCHDCANRGIASLESLVDLNVATSQGRTALHFAATGPAPEQLVLLLIQHGADVNASTSSGETPCHVAARHGNQGTVQLLLEHGAVYVESHSGHTPASLLQRFDSRLSGKRSLHKRSPCHNRLMSSSNALVEESLVELPLCLDRACALNAIVMADSQKRRSDTQMDLHVRTCVHVCLSGSVCQKLKARDQANHAARHIHVEHPKLLLQLASSPTWLVSDEIESFNKCAALKQELAKTSEINLRSATVNTPTGPSEIEYFCALVRHEWRAFTPHQVAELIHKFMDRINRMATMLWPCEVHADIQQKTETAIFERLKEKLFGMSDPTNLADFAFTKRIESLQFITLEMLDVNIPVSYSGLTKACTILKSVPDQMSPSAVAKRVGEAIQILLKAIGADDKLLPSPARPSAVAARDSDDDPDSEESEQTEASRVLSYGADELVPVSIYALLHANPPKLRSTLHFVSEFLHPTYAIGELGYYAAVFQSAASFLAHVDERQLGVSKAEFDRLVHKCLSESRSTRELGRSRSTSDFTVSPQPRHDSRATVSFH